MNSDIRKSAESPRETWTVPTLDVVRREPSTDRADAAEWGHVPAHLLRAWEAVYRDYVAASDCVDARNRGDREVQARLAAQLAVAWRRLARTPGVEWWLMATFSTAAEAMEQQAREWASHSRRSA